MQKPWIILKKDEIDQRIAEIKAAGFLAGGELNETWIRRESFEDVLGVLLLNGLDLHIILNGKDVSATYGCRI